LGIVIFILKHFMSLGKVLLEGRREDFIQKYRGKFNLEQLKSIIAAATQLSQNLKFIDFLGRTISPLNFEQNLNDAVKLVPEFVRYQENLPVKDINQYESIDQLRDVISTHTNRDRRSVQDNDGAIKIYEDDNFVIVSPTSHEGSCYYGAGTKWCTATRDSSKHFDGYNERGKLFYVISKKLPSDNKYYKIALYKLFSDHEEYYDAVDANMSAGEVLKIFGDTWKKVIGSINKFMSENYSDKQKIWTDRATAREEELRIRREAQEAERRRILAKQEGLRESDAWAEGNCDDVIATSARAVYQLIQSEGDVEEGEDIYYLVQEEYRHYSLPAFKWMGGAHNNVYAVGDDSDADEAAYVNLDEYVSEYGTTGFAEGFAENYIDKDAVVSTAEDLYNDWVRDSPEDHIDESRRQPSEKQKQFLEFYRKKLEILNKKLTQVTDPDDKKNIEDDIIAAQSEIEEIQENPEGDFSEEDIESAIEAMVSDVKYDPLGFLKDYDMEVENYIDREALIKGIIESDGRGGGLAGYDGEEHEQEVCGETYFIYQIE
jgi:hypothetical protein